MSNYSEDLTPIQQSILKKILNRSKDMHHMNILDFGGRNFTPKNNALQLKDRTNLDGINIFSANRTVGLGSFFEKDLNYIKNIKKHYNSDPASTKRISNDAFSLAFLTPNISLNLLEAIEDPSEFYEPDLDQLVKEYYEKSKERLEKLQEDKSNFSLYDEGLEEEEEETDPEKIAKKKEREDKRLMKEARFYVNKRWREKRKQNEESLRKHRDDHVMVNMITNYLKKGGYIIFNLPLPLINSSLAARLSRYYSDLRIYIDDIQYVKEVDEETGDTVFKLNKYFSDRESINNTALIIAKKEKQDNTQDTSILLNLIETANTKKVTHLLRRYNVTEEDLANATNELDKIPEENEDEIARAKLKIIEIKRKLISNKTFIPSTIADDMSYDEISIHLPTSRLSEVKEFRVGDLSYEDINEEAKRSNILMKTVQSHKDFNKPIESIAPTDLHQGHIVMLLTSGLMNGYIGSGADQHLIKGAAIKESNISTESVDNDIIRKESFYYNVSITVLDSAGDFKVIK